MTRAVILAAGEGARLRPHTETVPKCLVRFAGRPLLDWQVSVLRSEGIRDIHVVSGYLASALEQYQLPMRHNDRYAETNMVASLRCASDLFDGGDDVVIAYGDIVFEPSIVRALTAAHCPLAITVDQHWRQLWELRMEDPLSDAETLKLDGDSNVTEIGRPAQSYDEVEAQFMGLVHVAAAWAPTFIDLVQSIPPEMRFEGRDADRMYMTDLLQYLIDLGHTVRGVTIRGGWIELDTVEDLHRYEAHLARGEFRDFIRNLET